MNIPREAYEHLAAVEESLKQLREADSQGDWKLAEKTRTVTNLLAQQRSAMKGIDREAAKDD